MLRIVTDTTNEGDSRWGPPLVDEDWHAICQAIYKGARRTRMGDYVLQVRGDAQNGSTSRNQVSTRRQRQPKCGRHCGKHT